jgi:hypothetical protein
MPTNDPNLFYAKDMDITVGKTSAKGFIIVPANPAGYEFNLRWRFRAERITVRTCLGLQHYWKHDIDWNKKGLTVSIPHDLISIDPTCDTIHFEAYDLEGQNSFGVAMIANPAYQLPALIETNFKMVRFEGSAMILDAAGYKTILKFYEPVVIKPMIDNCNMPTQWTDNRTFKLYLSPGECAYAIVGRWSKKIMRLITEGYEAVINRGI